MLSTAAATILKVMASLVMRLVTAQAVEDLVLFLLKKLAANTASVADDELVAIVEKHLKKGE